MEFIKVKSGDFTPVPQFGWVVSLREEDFIICQCNCPNLKNKVKWPNKVLRGDNCGAHLKRKDDGSDYRFVAYKDIFGWTFPFTIKDRNINGNIISLYLNDISLSLNTKRKEEQTTKKLIEEVKLKECPLCGALGEDLIFNFYCRNPHCGNYHK